jgi:hypothetical protein
MAAKLTLSINEKTIQRAKLVSRKRGKSLSKMVEEYLETISEKEEKTESALDKVEKIMAPYLSKIEIPADDDYRREVREWQYEKEVNKKAKIAK